MTEMFALIDCSNDDDDDDDDDDNNNNYSDVNKTMSSL